MYCQYCGNEIDKDCVFCPKCGKKVNLNSEAPPAAGERDEFFKEAVPAQAYQRQSYAQPTKTNTLAIVGFILSFFVTIAGLVCSIIAYKQCNEMNEGGKGLAIAGIVISSVSMFIAFVTVFIIIFLHPAFWFFWL